MSAGADPCSEPVAPAKCRAHVEECTNCRWSGGNAPERPCVKCGGEVIRRPCKNWPMHGSAVCAKHGGRAGHVKRASRRRLALAKADKQLADLEYEPVGNPVEELADLAGQAKALMSWAGARVAELHNELSYRDDHEIEQLRAVVSVYERAQDRAAKMLESLAKLGLEERRTAVEAAKVQLVAEALRLALADAGVDQPQRVLEAFAVRARELESANGEGEK